jgi:hypothetical protein
MTNTMFVQVTHTLSENWTSKSKHVSVDQKYRNYKIPQDVLWRNLYWEDFLVASGSAPKDVSEGEKAEGDKQIIGDKVLRVFQCDKSADRSIDTLSWLFDTKDENGEIIIDVLTQGIGVTLPCTTYGVANSMVFSAEFKDQLSAGLRRYLKGEDVDAESGEDLNEEYLCEEALYCAPNGKLRSATIVLTDGYYSEREGSVPGYTEEEVAEYARMLYPIIKGDFPFKEMALPMILNYPVGYKDGLHLFSKKFHIDKQPGEAIKFTYQIHCVGEDGCVFGNKFAEHNTLVKKYEQNRVLKIWLLSDYIREGIDRLESPQGEVYLADSTNTQKDYYEIKQENTAGNIYSLNLSSFLIYRIIDLGVGCKAWAITDEENNLYVGRNNDTTGQIYFTMTHKRI